MDPSQTMLPASVQTLTFPSSCSFSSSRTPPTSPASRYFDATSFCSSSGFIESQYPTISQIIDCASPSSSSSQPILFRATASSSSMTLEPKIEYLPDVSNNSLKFPNASGKSLPHTSLVVDIPRPLESLQSSPIPPFLSKTYEMVNDPSLDRVVSWSPTGQSFVVWDPIEFSKIVLPRHFKHSNFSSFLRQLNTYGFRKIDGDRWEFANEEFLRGKRLLLKNINRRRSPRTQPKDPYLGSSMGMEQLGAEDELEKLRSDKHMLMQEVVKMKQEHLVTMKEIDELNCRLQSAELRQKQMMSFWAKVLRNPVFLMQLEQTKKLRKFASTSSIKSSLEPVSTSVLQGLESSSETRPTGHLLQDMSDKIGLDVNVQDGSSNKPLEIFEPSFSPNASFKGKNITVTKEDASLGSSDFYISSPEEFSSSKMVLEPISPLSESSTQQDFQIDVFNGESVGEIQDGMACHTHNLALPVNDASQEAVFLYSVNPGGEIARKKEFWDVEFEAGNFTSDHDVWDNIFCANVVVPGDEIGLSAMWDFGLHSDEGFDIDKCLGSEIPRLPDMNEDGLRDDHPKNL